MWKALKRTFFDWLDDRRDRSQFMKSVRHWDRAGALSPYSAAAEERALRMKLEDFRNFASRRYLEEPALSLDDIKQEWLDIEVKPMAKVESCRNHAKALKSAIQVMGDEMFVGLAAKQRKAYIDQAIADAKAQSPAIWKAQRERAMRV
jgi:hypothetical protein